MKKRKFKFDDGGDVGLDVMDETGAESKSKRNPETGELYNPVVKRNKETGEMYTSEMSPKASKPRSKPAAKPAPKATPKAEEPAGQIPGQSAKAPESSGGERSTERSRNIEAALGATGLGLGAAAAFKSLKALKAARDAKKPMEAVAKQSSEVAAKGREEITNPLMWMAGPKKASKFKEPKKGLSEADTSGGAVGYKRGGAVKSSASSRADGIAQRGRTKGRMY
jgi:hypothetical protein